MALNLDPRASPGSFFRDGSLGKSQIPPKCRKWVEQIRDFREISQNFVKTAEFRKVVRNQRRSFKTRLKNIWEPMVDTKVVSLEKNDLQVPVYGKLQSVNQNNIVCEVNGIFIGNNFNYF